MEMNDSANVVFLPIPFGDVSSLSKYRGFQNVYNNIVRKIEELRERWLSK
jgi:hypothetical protein